LHVVVVLKHIKTSW